jgi:hypothetical protein
VESVFAVEMLVLLAAVVLVALPPGEPMEPLWFFASVIAAIFVLGLPFTRLADGQSVTLVLTIPMAFAGGIGGFATWVVALRIRRDRLR